MKFIEKSREPKSLRDWKKANKGLPHATDYEAISGDVKAALRKAMRREQGDLCAYTMARIDEFKGSHIEHVQPQKHYPERATDYRNMVLCVPEKGPCEYGAIRKGDTRIDESNFVSRFTESCEGRLRYRLSGRVVPASEADAAAKSTIEILNLNHQILINARRDAFRAHGVISAHGSLSATQARCLSVSVLCRESSGRLPPYCVAVSQIAAAFARESAARARRIMAKPTV